MSYAATAQTVDEDRYYTQIEAGDVRLFTLDQLDAAFNVGLIHENTYVCLEGDSRWLTLGEVAGLGEEVPEPPPPPVPRYRAAAVPTYTTQAYSAPYSVAPMLVPPSIVPVVNDLSFDEVDPDLLAMRPKRHAGKVVAGLVSLALGGLGFMLVQSGGSLPKLPFAKFAAATLSLSKAGESTATQAIAPAKAVEPPRASEPPRATEPSSAVKPSAEAPPQAAAVASTPIATIPLTEPKSSKWRKILQEVGPVAVVHRVKVSQRAAIAQLVDLRLNNQRSLFAFNSFPRSTIFE